MPHQSWKHTCPKTGSTSWSQPGLPNLWRTRRVRRLASWDARGDGRVPDVLSPEAARPSSADGRRPLHPGARDMRGVQRTGASRRLRGRCLALCNACRGFGSIFTMSRDEIEALSQRLPVVALQCRSSNITKSGWTRLSLSRRRLTASSVRCRRCGGSSRSH